MNLDYLKKIRDDSNLIDKYQESGNITWVGKDDFYKIKDMTDKHIINAFKMLYEWENFGYGNSINSQWMYIFSWELAKRGIEIENKIDNETNGN